MPFNEGKTCKKTRKAQKIHLAKIHFAKNQFWKNSVCKYNTLCKNHFEKIHFAKNTLTASQYKGKYLCAASQKIICSAG